MSRTLIVSRETAASLLEAHAALAAWYHRHAQALRAAGLAVDPPGEPERLAFLGQVGLHFPELGEVARAIAHPRPYVPPPAIVLAEQQPAAPLAPTSVDRPADEPTGAATTPASAAEPASTTKPSSPPPLSPSDDPTAALGPSGALAPPPIVDPTKVKY